MDIDNLILRPLNVDDEDVFRSVVAEFKDKEPDFEFAFKFEQTMSFYEYIQMLGQWTLGRNLPEHFVPNTYLVGVIGKRIVGRVSIRHVLNDYLASVVGHIGYGVVPSERKKGYGSKLLNLAIPVASSLGLSELLITCDDDNWGSSKIIEKNGGEFECFIQDPVSLKLKKRYWINSTVNL